MPHIEDRDVTTAEICNRCQISIMTVYQWRRGNPNTRYSLQVHEVPWGERGHAVLIRESHLLQFLDDFRPDLLQLWIKSARHPETLPLPPQQFIGKVECFAERMHVWFPYTQRVVTEATQHGPFPQIGRAHV